MEYPNIHFNDSNDVTDCTLVISHMDASAEADVISYIKSQMAGLPGAGTVTARKFIVNDSAV